MSELLLVAALDAGLLLVLILSRDLKLIIPLVVIGLPVEYFVSETLGSLGEGGVTGTVRALLNPGKLAMVGAVLIVLVRYRFEPRRLLPRSALVLPVAVITAVMLLACAWSDTQRPTNMAAILPLYLLFVAFAPLLIEDRRDLERIVVAFLITGIAMSLIALLQQPGGVFQWRGVLVNADFVSYRSNALFADPNILARFLVLAMTLALGVLLMRGPGRLTVYLALPMLPLGVLGLIVSGSRSGLLMLAVCFVAMIVVAPIGRYRKTALMAGGAVIVLVGLGFVIAQGGAAADRIEQVGHLETGLGQRTFLIEAGLAMFRDHILLGVGTGNYEPQILFVYFRYIPAGYGGGATLSHTSVVTILAEQGIVGLLALIFLGVRATAVAIAAYRRYLDLYWRVIAGWVGVALLGIFLQSQSEGRLLEEPYLWFLLGVLAALETGPAFRALARTAPVAPEPPAEVVSSPPAALPGTGREPRPVGAPQLGRP